MVKKIHKQTMPILPLRDVVVYPNMVVPLFVGRTKSIKSLEDAMNNNNTNIHDLTNGNKKWKLKYKKDINTRVGGKKFINDGYNPWGGISLDDKRGILYFTTGNPHYYFDGTQRPGDNPSSNSIIAVDLNEKKVIWTFQETSHDIWNSDIPSPPILSSVNVENKKIDIVLAPTKRANTLILDRISGEPIFDFRYRKVPTSKVSGEKTLSLIHISEPTRPY